MVEKQRNYPQGIHSNWPNNYWRILCYLEVLKRWMAKIRRTRREYRDPETSSLLHNNASNHTSLIVREFLARNQVRVLNHSPYSPDSAPCDSSLFPKLNLEGDFFNDISTIKTAKTRALEAFPQNELEREFESLLNRCNKCIETGREFVALCIMKIPC